MQNPTCVFSPLSHPSRWGEESVRCALLTCPLEPLLKPMQPRQSHIGLRNILEVLCSPHGWPQGASIQIPIWVFESRKASPGKRFEASSKPPASQDSDRKAPQAVSNLKARSGSSLHPLGLQYWSHPSYTSDSNPLKKLVCFEDRAMCRWTLTPTSHG